MPKLEQFISDNLLFADDELITRMFTGQLYKVGSVKVQYDLLKEKAKSYKVVNGKEECEICHEPIGKSVICIDPNDKFSHYKCYQKIRD